MQKYQISKTAKNNLELTTTAPPKASGRQILIKIHGSSMNPHDWKYFEKLRRLQQLGLPLPAKGLGHDVAGVVVDTGTHASQFKIGDEVYSMSAKTGAFGEFITIDERMVALKPSTLSFTDAAAIPMASLTAYQVFKCVQLQTGNRVLIIGGSGGVGSFAIQLAKTMGAHVSTVCSRRNTELVRSLGADCVIDYTSQDFKHVSSRFDVIFDTVGNESLSTIQHLLDDNGRFATLLPNLKTMAAMAISNITGALKPGSRRVSPFLLAMPIGTHLSEIANWVDAGKIKPIIEKEFPLSDLLECMEYSKQGRTRGKLSINVSS